MMTRFTNVSKRLSIISVMLVKFIELTTDLQVLATIESSSKNVLHNFDVYLISLVRSLHIFIYLTQFHKFDKMIQHLSTFIGSLFIAFINFIIRMKLLICFIDLKRTLEYVFRFMKIVCKLYKWLTFDEIE